MPMYQKVYFDKDKNLNISSLLKDLPKVDAPDNFEYNLMVRIQNGNFDKKKFKEPSWRLSWLIAPGAALFFSVILLLNLFVNENNYDEKLVTDSAELINESATAQQFIWALTDEPETPDEVNSAPEPKAYQVVLNSNDVVETRKLDPSILKGRGYNLDVILDKAKSGKFSRGRGTLVSTGVPSFNFDGFFIRVDDDSLTNKSKTEQKGNGQK